MLNNEGYALLIGIDDYSAFDKSHGQDIGTSDLLGSRNDVRVFWRLCRLLGYRPENIRVLTSPPIEWNELEGASPETVAPATEAEIVAKVNWLAQKLGQDSRPTGLLTYSGHGDFTSHGLVLCPSDVKYDGDLSLSHAISFGKLNSIIGEYNAAENLTIVLDTCHSGGGGAAPTLRQTSAGKTGRPLSLLRRPVTSITASASKAGLTPPLQEINARVLAAARRDQVAYQSMFDGHYRGVFSWAIACAMEQWRMVQEDNTTRLTVSYGKLIETARRLISSLWFDQEPELRGPMGLADLAVFHPGLAGHAGETVDLPDGGFHTEQLDPGMRDYLIYQMLSQTGALIGKVLVTATAGGGYEANREYWYMSTNVSMSAPVTFVGGTSEYWSTPPSGLGTLSFVTNRTPSWTSATPPSSLLLYTNAFTGERIGLNWQMSLSRGVWIGTVTWWHSNTNNVLGPGVTVTLSPGTPASGTWYYYTTAPL